MPRKKTARRKKASSKRTLAIGDDEQTAEVLAELAEPLPATLAEIAKGVGISPNSVAKFVAKLRRKGLLLDRSLGEVSRSETRDLFKYRAHEILMGISPGDIDRANLRDKMLSAAIATDKALLLDGQPTEILSIRQEGNLDALAGLLLTEMRNRGMAATTDPTSQVVTLQRLAPGQGERGDPKRFSVAPSDEPR